MKNKTLLAVDDAQINRKFLCKLFSEEFNVIEAVNGKEALDIIQALNGDVDIIILDIIMPDFDGYYFLEEFNKLDEYSDIPIVISTTDTSLESESRLLDMGAIDILHKPFNPGLAVKRVKAILSKREADTQKNRNLINTEAERHNSILNQINTFVIEYSYENSVLYIDPAHKAYLHDDLTGFDIRNIESLTEIIYRPDMSAAVAFFDISDIHENVNRSISIRLLSKDSMYEWFRIAMSCYTDKNGNKTKIIITFNNINSEMEALKKLELFATSDRLTQIPNRHTFNDITKLLIDSHSETKYAVVRFDIESFKIINQIFGSAEGDAMLKYLAVKLQEIIESSGNGTYCRVTSDVFAFCVPYNEENIEEITDELLEAMRAYPVNFDVSLSFGVYVVDNKGLSVLHMLDRAAAAQKSVKGNFNNHISYFDDKLKKQEEIELTIISEMKNALESKEFAVYLQPKCDMTTGEIIGSEALVRWIHPNKGLISPGAFIPIFENNGFITELDYYVFDSVCELISKWLKSGTPVRPVSVNVSRADLYDPNLFANILKIVEKHNIPQKYIEFEITESSFVSDNKMLCTLTQNLQEHGFRVLMDDFGSGYSSLNSLKDIKVDVLKIDIKFLPTSATDERAGKILASVIAMAKSLELEVVVEGVETKEQVEFLLSVGAYFAQGYHFYRPMPIADYENILMK